VPALTNRDNPQRSWFPVFLRLGVLPNTAIPLRPAVSPQTSALPSPFQIQLHRDMLDLKIRPAFRQAARLVAASASWALFGRTEPMLHFLYTRKHRKLSKLFFACSSPQF